MPSSRKRRRHNNSAIQSPPSSPRIPLPEDDTLPKTQESHQSTPRGTQPSLLTDEEELLKATRIAANGVSASCQYYLAPKLSDQLDKSKRRMIAYPCKTCGKDISRPTSDSSCSNLLKHVATCMQKQSSTKSKGALARVGIKGTGDNDPKEVPQLCALWCAEAARPFSALLDASHQVILHPTVIKNLPTRQAVSNDIHLLYSAIQQNYKDVLEAHNGALYLGVNAWQSPNGEYLAEMVRLVVKKFGIQQKICGIVSDNTSNNKVMVRELKKQKWARFKGEPQWVRCFAHVLNLVVQGILRPFGTQKRRTAASNQNNLAGNDRDDSECSEDDTEGNIVFFQREKEASPDIDDDNESDVGSLDQEDVTD
ncbi:hypothetical protein PSTG_16865 [Puccinia striiformis f. sp. tritici PST-78]|uniref:DUF659 domain-containing protein n=1 Tax=Puccinia striiformis f. sp. tritici PST-78 TaxID=1165861 RepID=A0A0L0URG5_9BASI|nr:hypothetical protein PSTG_16865 [Puccinia striiformis f. sp. tritici PST-78]